MGLWQLWAVGAALFAAITAVLAKLGLEGIDANLATLLRTLVVAAALTLLLAGTGQLSWTQLQTLPRSSLTALLPVLEAMPRTQVLEASRTYLHATNSSALFGFVDDLELYADSARGVLQARSVSRLGDSDLGVNGRRLAALQESLQTAWPAPTTP